jgi:hypothetical protein
MCRRGEHVDAAAELADHAVDMPEAVAELDVVILLAEPRDVPLRIAQQPRGVQQVEASFRLVLLLVVLAPLAA